MKRVFKRAVIATLSLAIVAGGASSAWADGKGNGRGHGKEDNWKIEAKGHAKFKFDFSDLVGSDVEWALKYIASLASKGVFQGYEDGTFRPRNTVNRIEAIAAAVRTMGLEEQAESAAEMNTDLNFKDADLIEKRYPWAVGYVAVALENDLFSESDTSVQPEKAADRLWATTLIVKALKLDAEAKAKMNTKLTFKDANQIPAGSIGYVAVAVERGLIEGFENNTFRPNEPVTRAQLAKLLDLANDQLPGQEKNIVTGTVTAVSGNTVTLTKGGSTSQVTLDPGAFIYRGGQRIAIGGLQAGDEVRIKLVDNVGIYLEVTKLAAPAYNFTAVGRLYSYQWNADYSKIIKIGINTAAKGDPQQVTEYVVDPNYRFENGSTSNLVFDIPVRLKGNNQIVSVIEFLPN